MASTLLCLVILVTVGNLLDGTSALMERFNFGGTMHKNLPRKKVEVKKKIDIFQEARTSFANNEGKVRFNLAPSYGTLNSKTLQQLDESLKVMIGGILELDIEKGFTWKELKSALNNNSLIIRQPEYSAFKLEKIAFGSVRFFGLGSEKTQRSKVINTWFSTLIGNVDILEDTDIDLDSLAKMASEISVDMINNLWTSKSRKMTLMDLGILRFPDINKPFFSLYRINLLGKCTYQTYILHQQEISDIVGLFEREVYYPDREYIENLSRDLIDQLLSEVDDLFSDM